MTRTLVVLRHARAEHTPGPDAARPLAIEGRRQSAAVGAALAEDGLVPDVVLCSTAVRTRQTWDLVRPGLLAIPGVAFPDGSVTFSDDLYEATVADVLGLVRAVPDAARTVLVVGHEPTVSMLAAALAGPASDEAAVVRVTTGVPTAAWSVLTTDASWADLGRGGAVLTAVRTPG